MMKNDDMLREIENYLAQITIPSDPEMLYTPIRYTLAEGGKRLRPMLTMLAYELYGESVADAMAAAAAIEVFHNFTLLHDDIMDNAPTRRGKPSVPARWGANVAILSGDVMMILAYRLLARVEAKYLSHSLEVFNEMATLVCEGQQYDMDFESQDKVSVVEYMSMIELKTSVLLGGATHIGAYIGGASAAERTILQRFATELGLAFQLQDDLLDSYGDERLGKSIGGDILEGKQTFLKIMAISRADEPTRQILTTIHREEGIGDEEKISRVKAIYDSLDIVRITEQQIETKFERALSLLDDLAARGNASCEGLEAMREYAKSLMNRER